MKNKRNAILIIISSIFLICIVCFCIFINEQDSINSVRFIVNTDKSNEEISLFENNGLYYAFLPSYTNMENTTFSCNAGYTVFIDDKEFNDTCENLNTNQEYNIKIKNEFGFTVSDNILVIMKSANIHTLSIKLANGTIDDINRNKAVEKSGLVTLVDDNSELNYSGAFKSMHGRGNSTWGQQKKPYALEFSEDVNLLGMGAAKNWILLANAFDESNLRNKIVYDAAIEIGLQHSIKSEFVDLYVDGTYMGLYLLTEKVEVGQNRVNITDLNIATQAVNQYSLSTYSKFEKTVDGIYQKGFSIPNDPADITGGYLFEVQIKERIGLENSLFTSKNGINFSIKSPAYISENQIEYISSLFQNAEDSFDNETFDKYIDVDSWVNFYLIQELFGNTDSGSFFFYKYSDDIDGKLYAGPIWDFDLSMGNVWQGINASPSVFYTKTKSMASESIYENLYKNENFKNKIIESYINKMKPIIQNILLSKLDEYAQQIQASYLMNKARWKNIQEYEYTNHFDSLQQHTEYLSDFLNERLTFLDSAWIEGKDYCRVMLRSIGPIYEKYYYSVTPGEVFNDFPELTYDGYTFLGWFDFETDELANPKEITTTDKIYVAKWEQNTDKSLNENTTSISNNLILQKIKSFIATTDKNLLLVLAAFALMCFIILIFILKDLKQSIKLNHSRRYKNGK